MLCNLVWDLLVRTSKSLERHSGRKAIYSCLSLFLEPHFQFIVSYMLCLCAIWILIWETQLLWFITVWGWVNYHVHFNLLVTLKCIEKVLWSWKLPHFSYHAHTSTCEINKSELHLKNSENMVQGFTSTLEKFYTQSNCQTSLFKA